MNPEQHPRLGLLLPVMLSLAVTAAGCSSIMGERLGKLKDGNEVQPSGIPYTLTRPDFTLSRAAPGEGGKAGKYTLAVAYVPDPTRQYTIRLDAAAFADIDYVLKFGTGGVLSSLSSTTTEQITSGITALGSFSKDLIGTLATGVFDKDSLRNSLAKEIAAQASQPSCAKPADVGVSALVVANAPTPSTVAAVLEVRVRQFNDDDQMAGALHYASAAEKACLETVSKAISERNTKTEAPLKKAFDALLKAHLEKYPKDATVLQPLARAVASYDTDLLDKAVARIADRVKELQKNSEPSAVAEADSLDAVQGKARNAADAVITTKSASLLKDIVEMKPNVWLARHVLYLERELADLQLGSLQRPTVTVLPTVEQRRKLLEQARVDALGVRPQYQRSVALGDFLKTVPPRNSRDGTSPAATEYVAIRAEFDSLLAQIDARRSKVLSDGKPPTPPAPPAIDAVPVKLVAKEKITESAAPGWIDGEGKDAPEYVLVLEETK